MFNIHTAGSTSSPPIVVTMTVHQKPLQFEVDTGAAVTVISEPTFKSVFPLEKLTTSNALLKTYTGELMSVLG